MCVVFKYSCEAMSTTLRLIYDSNFEEIYSYNFSFSVVGALFLMFIHAYIKQLRQEKAETTDQPPPYVECLMNGPTNQAVEKKQEKKETEITIPEEKIEAENNTGKV